MSNEKITNRKTNFIIILLLVLVLSLAFLVGFFIVKDKEIWDITKVLKTNEEHTLLLDEFVVNLKSEKSMKSFLKIEIALMYEDAKDGEILKNSTNKIRDIIINQLRNKTTEEILDTDGIVQLKEEIINNINTGVKEDIINDIYFTELVIQ